MKRSNPLTEYDTLIKFLANKMRMFNTDHLKLLIDAKSVEPCTDQRDYSRVLRSAASRGLIKKTDVYQKSLWRGSNNLARCMWAHPAEEVNA